MLYGGSGLGTGVGVIIEIIRKNNSDYDLVPVLLITLESHPPGPRDPIYLGTLVKLFAESIPKFQEILARVHKEKFDTPFGQIEPLGFERFKICELIAELLHCSNMSLLNDPSGEGIIKVRDEERERVKRIIARARGEIESAGQEEDEDEEEGDGEGDDEGEKEGEEEGKGSKREKEKPDHPIENRIGELSIKNDGEKEGKSVPNRLLSDDDESEPGNIDQQLAEGEAGEEEEKIALSQSLAQQENSIRQTPVVGDQLKIALADNKCITTILEMFFKFPWNNFLHNVVFDIVQQILNGPMQEGYNKFLAIDLFGKGHLTEVIYKGHAACEQHEREEMTRLGYMGHLTLISEEVVKFTALYTAESVSPIVAEAVTKQEWIHYVTHTLVRTREQYNTILGGKRPDGTEYTHNLNAIILSNGEETENANEEEENEEDVGSELGENDETSGFHRQHHRHGGEIITDNSEGGIVVHHRTGGDFGYDEEEEDTDIHKGASDLDGSGDQFARYMSQQISGGGHFGSSDEEEDDEEWDNERNDYRGTTHYHSPSPGSTTTATTATTAAASGINPHYNVVANEEEEEEEDDDLGLVRSRSYNDMN